MTPETEARRLALAAVTLLRAAAQLRPDVAEEVHAAMDEVRRLFGLNGREE